MKSVPLTEKQIRNMYAELLRDQSEAHFKFCYNHNPPGVRYFECYSTTSHQRKWVAMAPGQTHMPLEALDINKWSIVGINHLELRARMQAWIDEDDEL